MISNVALQTTDTTGTAPAAAETGDTGAFDALLALQTGVYADAAAAAAAQVTGALEGTDLMEGTLEDSLDDSGDDAEITDGALGFLAALLPGLKVSVQTADSGSPVSAPPSAISTGDAGSALTAPGQAGAALDLAQAFASDASAGDDADGPAFATNNQAASVDTTNWSSLTGPAELFAHGARPAVERVESAPLTTHVRDPRWADDLGNRLASMVRTGESSASLQLTPVDLGPLEVNVAVRDQQATVHFGAANAETRALLEASIPRLREMLAAQGFSLMDSSVSHGFARQTRHEAAGTPRVDGVGESPTPSPQVTQIRGLLDLYA
jgi:flagellar hook-length control protein FliK